MKKRKIFLFMTILITTTIFFFPPSPSHAEPDLNHAPVFSKKTIQVGPYKIKVEIADNEEKREFGLMNRKGLSADEGMLFVFEKPRVLGFWMKNTLIPLSIGYFDAKGKLIQVLEMVPASPIERMPQVYYSSGPATYALEMNKGWFTKKKIRPGALLKR